MSTTGGDPYYGLLTTPGQVLVRGLGERSRLDEARSLTVAALTDEAAFDGLAEEWDQLLEKSLQRVFFLRWAWNRLWWQTYKPRGSRLMLIACRDSLGRLVGLAPFYVRHRGSARIPHVREIRFLGTGIFQHTSEYLDIISLGGYEQGVAEAVARFLESTDEWDRLCLNEVPASSAVLEHLSRALGGQAEVTSCNYSHQVDTSRGWESLKQGLGKSTRSNINYYTRRLLKSYECSFAQIRSAAELEPAMDAFVRLHQARWRSKGEPGSFMFPSFEAFLKEAMRGSLKDGRLRLWTLSIDCKVAAVLLAFVDNGVAHYFQGGFDPAYGKDSLGTVMIGLCIKDCADSGDIREFDFMGGDAQYKSHWTKSSRETVNLSYMRPGIRSALYAAGERVQQAGRSVLRTVVPGHMKAAGHRLIRHWRASSDEIKPAGRALETVSEEIEVRLASERDKDSIIGLVSQMYPGDMAARYEWLYLSNPHGHALTWIAFERRSGEAVGCTSVFPRKVMVGGRERIGSIGGDCYIEPRARRRGVATALHRASFKEMRERGVDFMYGPPVPHNLAALVKAGSRVVANFERWVRPLTGTAVYRAAFSRIPSRLEARLAGLPVAVMGRLTKVAVKELRMEPVTEFGVDFDAFFDRAAATHVVACGRDSSYLTWRYLEAPELKYLPFAIKRGEQLVGFVALEMMNGEAAVVDLFAADDAGAIDATLQMVVDYVRAQGCSRLEMSLTQGCAVARRLPHLGFVNRSERGFQVAAAETDPQIDKLVGRTAWHFTEADQDVNSVFGKYVL